MIKEDNVRINATLTSLQFQMLKEILGIYTDIMNEKMNISLFVQGCIEREHERLVLQNLD